jgi:endonuclease YncB( thermonuclease family)
MFLTLKSFAMPQFGGGGALLLAAAAFAAGLTAGALIAPVGAGRGDAVAASQTREAQPAYALRSGHPAEVVRVIDGDTFEARVRIWPGMDVTTRVRLRGIDAPELHARRYSGGRRASWCG